MWAMMSEYIVKRKEGMDVNMKKRMELESSGRLQDKEWRDQRIEKTGCQEEIKRMEGNHAVVNICDLKLLHIRCFVGEDCFSTCIGSDYLIPSERRFRQVLLTK
jgi:hypothetical protein